MMHVCDKFIDTRVVQKVLSLIGLFSFIPGLILVGRTFVRFVLVWICRFPLPLGVWEGLLFVIVALPGLFSYLFGSCVTYQTYLMFDRQIILKINSNYFNIFQVTDKMIMGYQ